MSDSKDWQREVGDAIRREIWSLNGPNRVVKVRGRNSGSPCTLGGYITVAKFLLGRTPQQIEHALGFPRGYLNTGARIYRFTRLPMAHEVEYDLTTAYPGGLAFNPAQSNTPYLPGHQAIHQWRIKDGVQIPVDEADVLDLAPGRVFPYDWCG